jgi:hypothetical protein
MCRVRKSISIPVMVLAAGWGIQCSSDGGNGPADLCGRLGSVPSCGAEGQTRCTQAIDKEKTDHPDCAGLLDALTSCIARLTLECGSTSLMAKGTTPGYAVWSYVDDRNFFDIGGQGVTLDDDRCSQVKRGFLACRSCPQAPGSDAPYVRGVAEVCDASGQCAAGLDCTSGMCTRACATDAECKLRGDGCGSGGKCAGGRCTLTCSTYDSLSCTNFGGTYKCVSGVCSAK